MGEIMPTMGPTAMTSLPSEHLNEEDFYGGFAEYLVRELEECTRAISIGESRSGGGKWTNPDVMGVYESALTDIIREEPVIVSGELKTATEEAKLMEGFAQACAYRLFTHKAYLAIPINSRPEAKGRIESLCQLFGIGLILFDSTKPTDPDWRISVRAVRGEPDSFYLNEYLKGARDTTDRLFSRTAPPEE